MPEIDVWPSKYKPMSKSEAKSSKLLYKSEVLQHLDPLQRLDTTGKSHNIRSNIASHPMSTRLKSTSDVQQRELRTNPDVQHSNLMSTKEAQPRETTSSMLFPKSDVQQHGLISKFDVRTSEILPKFKTKSIKLFPVSDVQQEGMSKDPTTMTPNRTTSDVQASSCMASTTKRRKSSEIPKLFPRF